MPVIFGAVGAPSTTSATDGANLAVLQGKSGEVVDTNLHGKWYTAAYRNRVFIGSTLFAGVTVAAVSVGTAPTYTIFNPLGSGVNLELISFDLSAPLATTMVIGTIYGAMSIQTPTSVTAGGSTISIPVGGGGTSQAKLYTAATTTAATQLMILGTITATTYAAVHYEFDGKVVLAPGSCFSVLSSPVQTGVADISTVWAEWPI